MKKKNSSPTKMLKMESEDRVAPMPNFRVIRNNARMKIKSINLRVLEMKRKKSVDTDL